VAERDGAMTGSNLFRCLPDVLAERQPVVLFAPNLRPLEEGDGVLLIVGKDLSETYGSS